MKGGAYRGVRAPSAREDAPGSAGRPLEPPVPFDFAQGTDPLAERSRSQRPLGFIPQLDEAFISLPRVQRRCMRSSLGTGGTEFARERAPTRRSPMLRMFREPRMLPF